MSKAIAFSLKDEIVKELIERAIDSESPSATAKRLLLDFLKGSTVPTVDRPSPPVGNTTISDNAIDRSPVSINAVSREEFDRFRDEVRSLIEGLSCPVNDGLDDWVEAIEVGLQQVKEFIEGDRMKTLLELQAESSIVPRQSDLNSKPVEAIDPAGGMSAASLAPIFEEPGEDVAANYPISGEVSEPAPDKDSPVGETTGGVSGKKKGSERATGEKPSQRSLTAEDRIALLKAIPIGEKRSKKAIGETMKYSSPIPTMITIERADPVKNPGNYKIKVALDRMFSIERVPKGTGKSGQELIYYTRIDGATDSP
jgi:hypothetical protein